MPESHNISIWNLRGYFLNLNKPTLHGVVSERFWV